jgi:hypothetical protein
VELTTQINGRRRASMKNPLDTVKGTLIAGFVLLGVAIGIIRIFSVID